MFQATIQKSDLIPALRVLKQITDSGKPTPLLSNVLLETGNGKVKLSATNFAVSLSLTLPSETVSEPASIVIPCAALFKILRSVKEKTMTIREVEEHWAHVEAGNLRARRVPTRGLGTFSQPWTQRNRNDHALQTH